MDCRRQRNYDGLLLGSDKTKDLAVLKVMMYSQSSILLLPSFVLASSPSPSLYPTSSSPS